MTKAKWKRPVLLFGIVLAVGCLLFILDILAILNIQPPYKPPPTKAGIRVHYYNKPGSISPDVFKICDYKCFLTWGSHSYYDSEVVLFHGPDISVKTKPPTKRNGQIWVLHSSESPANRYTKFSKWKLLFNWTMTYQRDTDILTLYGGFIKILETKENLKDLDIINKSYNVEKNWMSKENKVAWFASNCGAPSKRDVFVKALSKHVSVDIFGRCGKHKCSRGKELNCIEILRKKYKMYLSFENSLCRDYITEKSFKLYEHFANVIPITRGMGDQYSFFLPRRSFINTNEFTNIKQLGEHLKQVMESKEQFYKYFEWRRHYFPEYYSPREFCDLCQKLHEPDKYQRIYENLGFFLNGETYKPYCHGANDIL